MLRSRKSEIIAAAVLVAPFIIIFAVIFVWPTLQMVQLSFQKAPLIGPGKWVGLENYEKLLTDRIFRRAIWNTSYFVLLTVIPGTLVAMGIALMVNRLKGWMQSIILAMFFLPYILPVTVIVLIWAWTVDFQYGILQYFFDIVPGERIPVFQWLPMFMPTVALITIWWTNGFSILLFLAALRNIPLEVLEAAALDGASRWTTFRRITWPLIWPVTVLCLTIQLILQMKVFDQVYLFGVGGRTNDTMVLVQYIFKSAFVDGKGGYAAAVAVCLFVVVVIFSVLQFQALRARGE